MRILNIVLSDTCPLNLSRISAWPFGTPSITSGYTFSNNDDGAPNGGMYRIHHSLVLRTILILTIFPHLGTGTCYGNGGVNGWLCTHRCETLVLIHIVIDIKHHIIPF